LTNLVAKGAADRFGRYHVLGALGEGSLGQLLAAEQSGADGFVEIVALRSFHPHLAETPVSKRLLGDAARLAAKLKHLNVAATDELEEFEGSQFQATEYLPGESIASILASCGKRTPIPPAIVAVLLQECAEGLRYALEGSGSAVGHVSLVHGDMRPSNIFVTYRGVAKVLGFGTAGLLSQVPSVRGSSRGGFAYTAPESLESGVFDTRGDVFSMGVVLWECLTGQQLFGAETIAKSKEAVRSRYIEPPSVLQPEGLSGLDEVVLRSLSRDPKRRYQSVGEFSQALKRVLMALPAQPTADNVSEWLRHIFGNERAALKMQIAHGSAVQGALARLQLLGEPAVAQAPPAALAGGANERSEPRASIRLAATPNLPPPFPAGTTNVPDVRPQATPLLTPAIGAAPAAVPIALAPPAASIGSSARLMPAQPGGRPRPPLAIVGGGAALVALVVGFLLFRPNASQRNAPNERAAAVGSLLVQSTPAGAQVLIDGDPSGLMTPARINGLRTGRKVDVQVDKPGFRSTKQTVEVATGEPRVLSFALEESMGIIRLDGIPTHATAFVDDAPVNASQPLSLPLGPHRLRVEISGQLFSAMKLDVQKGKQLVRVRPSEGATP
jgi:serine/threonine-protein kinase